MGGYGPIRGMERSGIAPTHIRPILLIYPPHIYGKKRIFGWFGFFAALKPNPPEYALFANFEIKPPPLCANPEEISDMNYFIK